MLSKRELFQVEDIIDMTADFFIAGTLTTNVGIMTGLYFCMKNPEMLEKIRQEVDEFIG